MRLAIAACVLVLSGCTGSAPEPAADPPSPEDQFLSDVAELRDATDDDTLLEAAQGACFEMELHVKTRRDLRLFYRVFAARAVVPAPDAPLLLAAAMKNYCPSMERLRPSSEVSA